MSDSLFSLEENDWAHRGCWNVLGMGGHSIRRAIRMTHCIEVRLAKNVERDFRNAAPEEKPSQEHACGDKQTLGNVKSTRENAGEKREDLLLRRLQECRVAD